VIQDGWLLTGDMATMDEDGFFAIVDRKKDLIIASGFNIYPREIEEVLYEHAAIKEVAVAGVPDQYRGETVKAFLVLRDGAKVTDKELEAWCRERLAAFKVPRKYEFRESLPKTMVGKVLRRKLLEEEADGQNKEEKQ
jgi:long-chain acyl-CoA synthetase